MIELKGVCDESDELKMISKSWIEYAVSNTRYKPNQCYLCFLNDQIGTQYSKIIFIRLSIMIRSNNEFHTV